MKEAELNRQLEIFAQAKHSDNWIGKTYQEFLNWLSAEHARLSDLIKGAEDPSWAKDQLETVMQGSLFSEFWYYKINLDDLIEDPRKRSVPLVPRWDEVDQDGRIVKKLGVDLSFTMVHAPRELDRSDPFSLRLGAPAIHALERVAHALYPTLRRRQDKTRKLRIEQALRARGKPFHDNRVLTYATWFIDPLYPFGRGGAKVRCFDPETLTDPMIVRKYQSHAHINKGLISLIEVAQHHIRLRGVDGDLALPEAKEHEKRLRRELARNGCIGRDLQDILVQLIDFTPARHERQLQLDNERRRAVSEDQRLQYVTPMNERRRHRKPETSGG